MRFRSARRVERETYEVAAWLFVTRGRGCLVISPATSRHTLCHYRLLTVNVCEPVMITTGENLGDGGM